MRKTASSSLVSLGIMGLLLFLPAGTLAWPQAWALLALLAACGVATVLWLRRTDPELLEERGKSVMDAGQSPRDRLVMGGLLVFFALWLVVMALDACRFGWSHVPVWGQGVGVALIVATHVGFATVFRENRFAVTQIKLQADRGQTVISSGPYAWVRHPMYAYALLFLVGVPLMLGSLWGLLGLAVGAPLFGARALGEEAMLMVGLSGYRAYAVKVRWRLVPGVGDLGRCHISWIIKH